MCKVDNRDHQGRVALRGLRVDQFVVFLCRFLVCFGQDDLEYFLRVIFCCEMHYVPFHGLDTDLDIVTQRVFVQIVL